MHLLEAGVNLIYISDLLGHKSISTSQIYAKANPETKRKEIEAHSDSLMIKTRYSKKEQADLLAWLKSIQ
jgi:site-specific recombinase XerD